MLHYVMTIQSLWNREPKGAVTISGTVTPQPGDTRSTVYEAVRESAIEALRARQFNESMGEVVVVFFSLESDAL